jgi:flagellar operon protein
VADQVSLNLPQEIRIGSTRPASTGAQSTAESTAAEGTKSFRQLLQEQLEKGAPDVTFSAHAQSRLESRNIVLNESHMARVGEALSRAAEKGAKEALVVMDDLALVVSVPNRTVITAVDGASRRGNVFTNIDSAVII